MKKLLILIVAIALYFHFYPNEQVNNWLSEQKEMVLDTFSNATDTRVRLNSEKILEDVSQHFAQFNTEEETFISEMTSTRESVKAFYKKHCDNQQPSHKLHRENLKLVCQSISKYSNLL